MYDWTRLLRCSGDLAQRKGAPLRPISRAEIREHGFEYDAWIILHGKVYNVTPYLAYHPGGIDIMKGVLGGDATVLFEKFHRWVNVNGLIGPLLLGTLEEEKIIEDPPSLLIGAVAANPPTKQTTEFDFAVPAPRPRRGGGGASSSKSTPLSILGPTSGSRGSEDEDDLNPWEK